MASRKEVDILIANSDFTTRHYLLRKILPTKKTCEVQDLHKTEFVFEFSQNENSFHSAVLHAYQELDYKNPDFYNVLKFVILSDFVNFYKDWMLNDLDAVIIEDQNLPLMILVNRVFFKKAKRKWDLLSGNSLFLDFSAVRERLHLGNNK